MVELDPVTELNGDLKDDSDLKVSGVDGKEAPVELQKKVSYSEGTSTAERAERRPSSEDGSEQSVHHAHHGGNPGKLGAIVHIMQKYSLPLLSGIVIALIWINVHPYSYEVVLGTDHDIAWRITGDWTLMGHPITIHFLINDIFMVFFFGIAAKEVTESCLPGGSLNPPRKALSPLVATAGGVSGPIAVYFICCIVSWNMGAFDGYVTTVASGSGSGSGSDSGRQLDELGFNSSFNGTAEEPVTLAMIMNGWGVPTATDISLAWMVAVQVFPFQHPAIDFLLLLAVADDAIGLIIIATAYSDPAHPFDPKYLSLIFGGAIIAYILRVVFRLQHWSPYILLGGAATWFGLIGAALHPALALCFVVPFLPSKPPKKKPNQLPTLQAFEHDLKKFVDFGMFFFTLANAGVQLKYVGALTWTVLIALIFGKIIGVSIFVLSMDKVKCAPLHKSIKSADVAMVGSMASIGLTVALFVSGEAFADPRLQGEAKLGALLSGLMGVFCLGLAKSPLWRISHEGLHKHRHLAPLPAEVKHPPRPAEADVADQQYYKHLIRAHETAFMVPADQADRAGLFEFDHDRAVRHWKDLGSAFALQSAGRKVVPIVGLTKEATQRNVLSAFRSSSGRGWGCGAAAVIAAGAAGGGAEAPGAAGATEAAEATPVQAF